MSRFYGSFESDSTKPTTKCGHSFVYAHVCGWDIGGSVYIGECPICGADKVTLTLTGGSNGNPERPKFYKEWCLADCQK